jgi:tetratricopeptide (TPR) repeat protein
MQGLPNEIYNRCRDTLLQCSEFDSDTALKAVFVTDTLSPFRARLPEAAKKSARVDTVLDYLLTKSLKDNQPVLPLFLTTLRNRYSPGDALRDELEEFAKDTQVALSPIKQPKTQIVPVPTTRSDSHPTTEASLRVRGIHYIRRQWVKIASFVVTIVTLLAIFYIVVSPKQPKVSKMVTPTPNLPDPVVILSANLENCDEPINLINALPNTWDSVDLGGRTLDLQRYNDLRGDELLAEAERLGSVIAVWGECVDAETWEATIAFTATSPYPVSLLREPAQITLRASPNQIKDFVRAGSLYAVGQYESASTALENLAQVYANDPAKGDRNHFYWLWGNIQLRLGDWPRALTAYSHALNGPLQDISLRTDLLANRGLAGLFAAQASGDYFTCGIQSREDLERAIDVAPKRPDLHVLLGTITLLCPREDQDIEEKAREHANEAKNLDQNFAPVYALLAQIGEKNQAKPEIGDPLLIQQYACMALELNETLSDPHRILCVIYRKHGLDDRAREEFAAYAKSATLEWQRQQAWQLMAESNYSGTSPAPIGLGQCE